MGSLILSADIRKLLDASRWIGTGVIVLGSLSGCDVAVKEVPSSSSRSEGVRQDDHTRLGTSDIVPFGKQGVEEASALPPTSPGLVLGDSGTPINLSPIQTVRSEEPSGSPLSKDSPFAVATASATTEAPTADKELRQGANRCPPGR